MVGVPSVTLKRLFLESASGDDVDVSFEIPKVQS